MVFLSLTLHFDFFFIPHFSSLFLFKIAIFYYYFVAHMQLLFTSLITQRNASMTLSKKDFCVDAAMFTALGKICLHKSRVDLKSKKAKAKQLTFCTFFLKWSTKQSKTLSQLFTYITLLVMKAISTLFFSMWLYWLQVHFCFANNIVTLFCFLAKTANASIACCPTICLSVQLVYT